MASIGCDGKRCPQCGATAHAQAVRCVRCMRMCSHVDVTEYVRLGMYLSLAIILATATIVERASDPAETIA